MSLDAIVSILLPVITSKAGIATVIFLLLSFVEVSKIKINPWSWAFGWIGKKINRDLSNDVAAINSNLEQHRETLAAHIKIDDERDADLHRHRILRFNSDLVEGRIPTREYFIEIMQEIDAYEKFCTSHDDYKNNRAKNAIVNITRCYNDRQWRKDFSGDEGNEKTYSTVE